MILILVFHHSSSHIRFLLQSVLKHKGCCQSNANQSLQFADGQVLGDEKVA